MNKLKDQKMKMIRQAIQTPDGTILESRHRHDYVTHVDKVTGEQYMIDGGTEYRRGSINQVPAKDMSVYLEDGIEAVREAVTWGTRGINGDEPLRWIKLRDMTTDHIQACLDTQSRMHPNYREAFEMELEYRKQPQ
jgi:hypothetical protein